jgi:LysR family transcriptional regulator, glycine cleavage system transcriptional activator
MDTSPRVSLHLMRGFRAAARRLSFTHAATELFVTQSAISREVKKLEEQIGRPLFHRVNRTLQLTPAGEELYRAVDDAFRLIDAAVERVTGLGKTLAVTATVPLASLWLVPRLPRFTQSNPDVWVQIAANDDVVDLAQAHLDIAIRYARRAEDVPFSQWLFDYSTFPVCAPALLHDSSRPLQSVADLRHHVLLEFETTAHGRPWHDWDQWFRALKIAKVTPAGRQRFSHYDQVIEAALAGSGVAIGKRPHLNARLREGTLRAPFGREAEARLGGFYVVVADAAIGCKAAESFVRWLHDEALDEAQAGPAEQTRSIKEAEA